MICRHCAAELGPRYHALERRIEQLEYSAGRDDKAPEASCVCHILHADAYPWACSAACWAEIEADIVAGFLAPYPASGPIAVCSVCGKPVDRLEPHVTLVVSDLETHPQPWLTTATVHHEQTLAVFCPACHPPQGEEREAEDARPPELARAPVE